jgi:hypothetical protein
LYKHTDLQPTGYLWFDIDLKSKLTINLISQIRVTWLTEISFNPSPRMPSNFGARNVSLASFVAFAKKSAELAQPRNLVYNIVQYLAYGKLGLLG